MLLYGIGKRCLPRMIWFIHSQSLHCGLDMRTNFIFQDRWQQDLGHKGIFERNGFQFFFSRRPSEFPGKIDFFIFYNPKQTVNTENDLECT